MFFKQAQDYFGLDISDRSLKGVQFKHTFSNKLALAALSQIQLEEGVFEDGELKNKTAFITAVKNLIAKPQIGKFTSSYTVACLPETKTFIKMIDIPPMSEEEIPQAIKWESEHHIPIPIDDTYWDWQQIGSPTKLNARLPILLGVAPKGIVDSYSEALSQANLVPVAMEIEAIAIIRSLLPIKPERTEEATMIIDIGATRTSLIVFDANTIQFTVSLPISGRKITQTIASTLNLSEEQAEKAKIVCGLDPKKCQDAMREILHSMMDELIKSINEAIVFYREHFSAGHKINHIILCGGGSNFKSIDEYLKDKLTIEVLRGNPWRNLEPSPPSLKSTDLIPYTTAIGLALRSLDINSDHD